MFRFLSIAVALVLALAVGAVAPAAAAPASDDGQLSAAAKKKTKKKKRRICKRGEKPKGKRPCIRPPRGASRPRGASQQGGPTDLVPEPKGAGLGAGGFNREEEAIKWAESMLHKSDYGYRCQRFVENAFNVTDRFKSAAVAAKELNLHDSRNPPRGALVFFRAHRDNLGLGHVGIAVSKNRFISALDKAEYSDFNNKYWQTLYLGWTYAPDDWPGRPTVPPDPGSDVIGQGPGASAPSVAFTSPAAESTLSGLVTLTARANPAIGVQFDAYYATDPANPATLGWHKLGEANTTGDGNWSLPYNTTAIPDQGNPAWTTVNLRAVILDGAGVPTTVSDVRRVNISNAVPPPAAPPPPPRRVITVDNRVTNGMGMREDTTPARLTTQPWVYCGSRGCNIAGTEPPSTADGGARLVMSLRGRGTDLLVAARPGRPARARAHRHPAELSPRIGRLPPR